MAKKKPAVTLSKRCEQLFHSHQTIAIKVAKVVSKRVPRSVELDDLIQAGQIGLLDAAQRFKPARGVKFGTFALWRVRGAIMDWLRQQDIVPRSVRIRQTTRRKAEQSIIAQDGVATAEAVKAHLKWSESDYRMSLPRQTHQMSILAADCGRKNAPFDVPCSSLDEIRHFENLDGMKGLVRHLSVETFVLFYLYYWRGMTMRRIGEVLGVSESRVSQMHSEGITILRGVSDRVLDSL